MTREEAINELKDLKRYTWDTYLTDTAQIYSDALNMGIKALETKETKNPEFEYNQKYPYSTDCDRVAMRVKKILWVDYCDCDSDTEEEMESEIGDITYDAIRYKPFEVIEMLLTVISDKEREIDMLDEMLQDECERRANMQDALNKINRVVNRVLD